MNEPERGPDFIVLTGFLGSGKTTLLADYLASPDAADTAVIVNEVGAIGLDGALLAESGDTPMMRMMTNGCVCCQLGGDLSRTVEALLFAERPGAAGPLRRIVLETSGLSKPGPLLRQLSTLAEHRMPVSVVATYDAVRGAASAAFEEAAAQWAGAGVIVVTKADLISQERLAEATEEARGLNPLARVVASPERRDLFQVVFERPIGAPPPSWPAGPRLAASPHPRVSVHLVRFLDAIAYDDLAAWLDNLAGVLGERLLRLKGLVRVVEDERPLLVQSVGTMFSAPRPFAGPSRGSSLVVIGRDVEEAEIAAVPPRPRLDVSRSGAGLGATRLEAVEV